MTANDTVLLRRALIGNALFSTLSGVVLLAVAGPLAPLLGVPAMALRVVGAALLPFAYGLWRNANREVVRREEAWVAVALDAVWVIASAVLVFGELWPLETAGVVAVAGVASVVLCFAVLQALGLARVSQLATERA